MMNEPPVRSPAPALVLAFLPSALALILAMAGGQNGPSAPVLWALCAVSVVCCFTAAFLLFRRKAVWAIVVGILFVLLNGAIAFFVGCVALLKGMNL